jgi:hypothetical protein
MLAGRIRPRLQDVAGDHERPGDHPVPGNLRIRADVDQCRARAHRGLGSGWDAAGTSRFCPRPEAGQWSSAPSSPRCHADPPYSARGADRGPRQAMVAAQLARLQAAYSVTGHHVWHGTRRPKAAPVPAPLPGMAGSGSNGVGPGRAGKPDRAWVLGCTAPSRWCTWRRTRS